MFLGHFAVGLAAKPVTPRVSLGTLFIAAQFADLLWPNLLLAGVERVRIAPGETAVTPLEFVSYPFSHSLLALAVWGALFALAHWLVRRCLWAAVVVGGAVISHWFLDWIAHGPDMPLTFAGEARLGLGLWNSVAATVVVEVAILAVGTGLYLRVTRARDRIGGWGVWGMVALLLAIYVGSVLGPPPPSVAAIAWAAQAMWLIVILGYWIDRHRVPAQSIV